jgi:hypothetical protein
VRTTEGQGGPIRVTALRDGLHPAETSLQSRASGHAQR